jgi:alcohol dehydrogenase
MLADILPTSYEVGVLNGHFTPGDVVAIVGAGPIGLAAMMTRATETGALKVVISVDGRSAEQRLPVLAGARA